MPKTEAEFLFRRLTDPISLALQELSGLRLAAFLALVLAILAYMAWMAVREVRARGWPWAAFRIASRLLCYLALVGFALALRAGDSEEDGVRHFLYRTSQIFAVLFVAGMAYYAYWKFRQEASLSGSPTALALGALRLLTYFALPALFLIPPEIVENAPPVLLPGYTWMFVLIPVLAFALVFVVWMYARDARTAGPLLAAFLAVLRCGVYAVLALVFLLPALQMYETTETPFKILVLFDVSRSMHHVDDLPRVGEDPASLPSRQDKLIKMVMDGDPKGDAPNWLKQLQDKSALSVYRFGGSADATPWVLKERGQTVGAAELREFLKPDVNKITVPDDVPEAERPAYRGKAVEHVRRLLNGTNIFGSLVQVRKREAGSLVQAVIVVSDGRSNQGSRESLNEFHAWANDPKRMIPVFSIGVGADIQPKAIRLDELKAPEQARPDDQFPVVVQVFGTGLHKQPFDVSLEALRVKDRDGNPVEEKPIPLPDKKTGTFSDKGQEAKGQVEFKIDLQTLKNVKAEDDAAGELEGTWEFRARVPRHPEEAFAKPEHVSERPAKVVVVKRPLRVLLFAGGPSRDYQFLRTLFFREVRDKRMEMSIYLQTQASNLTNVQQDVEANRLLQRFPSHLGPDLPEDPYGSLDDYDVIVAFDPDWKALSPEQLNLVKQWVGDRAGGIVFVAGPVNSNDLAHKDNKELEPVNVLYPVSLVDSRLFDLGIDKIQHKSDRYYPLHFSKVASAYDYLKIDGKEEDDSLAGWDDFFWGGTKPEASKDIEPRRGFHNYHPVKSVKPTAEVIATFGGPPASRINDGKDEMPYLVSMRYGKGKTFYIGSAETFRLRMHKMKFHERFWIKLVRDVGSGNLSKLTRYGSFEMVQNTTTGNVRVEAELLGPDLSPLSRDARPEVKVKRPDHFNPDVDRDTPEKFVLKAKQTAGGAWTGKFEASVPFMTPGDYELELQIPGTPETLHHSLSIREPDIEIENVRPDFGELHAVASDANVLLKRLDRKQRERLLKLISTPVADKQETKPADAKDAKSAGGGERLFFELNNAAQIPSFLEHLDPQTDSVKGRLQDLWDRGFASGYEAAVFHLIWVALAVVGLLVAGVLAFLRQYRPAGIVITFTAVLVVALLGGNYVLGNDWVEAWGALPLDMSTVLGIVVGLLSLEWLIRKLIRLA
jgi:hypothetical protein